MGVFSPNGDRYFYIAVHWKDERAVGLAFPFLEFEISFFFRKILDEVVMLNENCAPRIGEGTPTERQSAPWRGWLNHTTKVGKTKRKQEKLVI